MPSTELQVEDERATIFRSPRKRLSSRWLVGVLLLLSLQVIAQEKRLSIYAPQVFFQASVTERGKDAYVGLFDILEPLGRVESRIDGKKWKLTFTGSGEAIEAEFQD